MRKILTFDPSGNWKEGGGTSGWALFRGEKLTGFGHIQAKEYASPEEYWSEHLSLIVTIKPDVVVYETYKLQAGKAMQQSWSELETPQLIGIIRHYCWEYGIPCYGQDPMIKQRFNDDILVRMGIAEKRGKLLYVSDLRTNDHMRDAIRHGLYFIKYGKVL